MENEVTLWRRMKSIAVAYIENKSNQGNQVHNDKENGLFYKHLAT